MAKYSIGIDLGTTNCVLAYTELAAETPRIQILEIEQATAPSQSERLSSLPSFLYLPTEAEAESGAFDLPELPVYPTVNGTFAREISAERPERTVAASKSWLCHAGVDRHGNILPWDSHEAGLHKNTHVTAISPVTAAKLLLRHMIDAWERAFPDAPVAEQRVTLTVPASFDMAARELTREAALSAGLPVSFILLEEPQAAMYHWLDARGDAWRKHVSEGDSVLVCDVGGGTTDLTLMQVQQAGGELVLNRVAVGNHLLVGGDNMDLTLAHYVAAKFSEKGTNLDAWQSVSLWHSCRRAKESLLAAEGRATEKISVLGRGSKLIGGTVSVEVDRDEVQQLLIDGFLPIVEPDAQPQRETRSGFHELGLPYEQDSAVTRHVAAFLTAHRPAAKEPADSGRLHLLLNGGVFKAPALQERATQAVQHLVQSQVTSLTRPDDLDFAVARGAAYYGWTKQHGGVRIRGGTARSYYVGIETSGLAIPGMPRPLQALCVVPFGMEEGTEAPVPGREVGLVVGRKTKFRFFASAVRKQDQVGTILRGWNEDELVETSPIELNLEMDDPPDEGFVPVRFLSRISELGVLELWCQSVRDDQRWKLELSVREDSEAKQA